MHGKIILPLCFVPCLRSCWVPIDVVGSQEYKVIHQCSRWIVAHLMYVFTVACFIMSQFAYIIISLFLFFLYSLRFLSFICFTFHVFYSHLTSFSLHQSQVLHATVVWQFVSNTHTHTDAPPHTQIHIGNVLSVIGGHLDSFPHPFVVIFSLIHSVSMWLPYYYLHFPTTSMKRES